jgi:hypothetical protein
VDVLLNRRTQDRIITGHSNTLASDRAIVHSVQAHYCVRFEEREDDWARALRSLRG